MFRRWFQRSNRLQNSDPTIRLAAIEGLDAAQISEQQGQLVELARSDSNTKVRIAAIQRLDDDEVLGNLLGDPNLADHSAKRIAHLIKLGKKANHAQHPQVLSARIAAADPTEIATLAAGLAQPEDLCELAIRHRDAVREQILALPALSNEAGLQLLEKTARGRDKQCYRFAKQKLEAIKGEKANCQSALERVAELDVSILKELKQKPHDADQLIIHRTKLSKLSVMREDAVASFAQAQQQLNIVGGKTFSDTPAASPLTNIDLSIPDPLNNPFNRLVSELDKVVDAMKLGTPIEEITPVRDVITTAWVTEADHFPPNNKQHHAFDTFSKQYQAYKKAWSRLSENKWADEVAAATNQNDMPTSSNWLKTWQKNLKQLAWPANHTPPGFVTQMAELVDNQLTSLQASEDDNNAKINELKQLLSEIETDITNGKIKSTGKQLRLARNLQSQVRHKSSEQRINALSAQLSEYQDWQKFATSPKRQELLGELTALADNPLPAQKQAARLRKLRSDWQQLGRPQNAEEADLHKQFDAQAEQAYAPCKVYYEEQNSIRASNLLQREQICEQLDQYLSSTDWQTVDVKAAETILRTARDTWREYHPCERKALKPLEARFEALQSDLHNRIRAVWEKNSATKQALIDAAKQLLEGDLEAQISGAKELQHQWRQVGPMPHNVDQKLWREFRQLCDQIFTARDASHQAQQQQNNAQLAELDSAVDALEKQVDEDPLPSVGAIKQSLSNIEDFSSELRVPAKTRQRLQAAQQKHQERIQANKRIQAEQQLANWQAWDIQVSEAEASQTQIDPPDAIFASRCNGESKPTSWQQLTLTAEIVAELPSREEDQNARMTLQIEMINSGKRAASAAEKQTLQAQLLQQWCAAGPKDDLGNELRQRFFTALAALS